KIGLCKIRNLQYEDALAYFEVCENHAEIYDDKKTYQLVLYDKALCYKKLNKLELAVETIDKYLNFKDRKDTPTFYIYASMIKANCYDEMSKFDRAIEIYNMLISQISEDSTPLTGLVYSALGTVYLHKEDFDASLRCFEKSLQIRSVIDRSNLSHTLIEMAELFLKQKLYYEAINTIKSGLAEAESYKDYEYMLKGNNKLANIYEDLKDTAGMKEVYVTIADLLKTTKDYKELVSVYVKLALIYIDENDNDTAKEYLKRSQEIDL
ncbi:MAG: tetratricopeptide repeat protein, partial [Bacillota bacterium]|nr:tetratricopeptide repeat protein [Bacillota bacterium]